MPRLERQLNIVLSVAVGVMAIWLGILLLGRGSGGSGDSGGSAIPASAPARFGPDEDLVPGRLGEPLFGTSTQDRGDAVAIPKTAAGAAARRTLARRTAARSAARRARARAAARRARARTAARRRRAPVVAGARIDRRSPPPRARVVLRPPPPPVVSRPPRPPVGVLDDFG